ncbi:hypothetical protein MRX96_046540 [Rhipicephalus microplus]
MLSILRATALQDSHPQKTTSWTPQMTRSKTVARRRGTSGAEEERRPRQANGRGRLPFQIMHLQPSLRHPVNAALERSHPCAKTLSMSVPACRLGAHKVIQAPFRSTVRVSLRASAAEYTTLARPTIACTLSELGNERATAYRAAGSEARGDDSAERGSSASPDQDEATETDSVASFKKRVPPSQMHARARRLSAVENGPSATQSGRPAPGRVTFPRSSSSALLHRRRSARERGESRKARAGPGFLPSPTPSTSEKTGDSPFAHSQATTTTFSLSPQRSSSSKNNDAGRHKVAHCCRLEQRGGNETERKGASARIRRTSERRKGAKIPDKWSSDTARETAAI